MNVIKKVQLYFISKVLKKFAEDVVVEIEIAQLQIENGVRDDSNFSYLDGRLSAFNTVLWWISGYSSGKWNLFD